MAVVNSREDPPNAALHNPYRVSKSSSGPPRCCLIGTAGGNQGV